MDELVDFVRAQKLLSAIDKLELSENQLTAMTEMCHFLKAPVPARFSLTSCDSPAILLHWKVLTLLAASLAADERADWKRMFCLPEEASAVGEEEGTPKEVPRRYPEAFDAHFHLDRAIRDLGLRTDSSLEDLIQVDPVDELKRITLIGAVAIYCDPTHYPSNNLLVSLPAHIKVGA